MKIRQNQFDRLLQQDPQVFEAKILQQVRQSHPTYRQTDAMLRDSIRAGLKRARAHSLTSDQQLMEYVLIMFQIAPNFDQQPKIAEALADMRQSPSDRWERIFEEDFDDAWHEADQPEFYDERFWTDPDELATRAAAAPAPEPTMDDWAELVVGLMQAQEPSPYAAASPQELADAKRALAEALSTNRAKTPADWEKQAQELAAAVRNASGKS
jgi:hypothetical protein